MHVIARMLVLVSSLLMAAMVGLTFVDVVGRYVFNNPVNGAQEITSILLGLTIFTALPAVTMREGHITVDFLQNTFSGKLEHARKVVVHVATACALGVLAYVLFKQAGKLAFMEMRTPHLHLPQHLIVYVFFAMAVVALVLTWVPLRAAITGKRRVRERA